MKTKLPKEDVDILRNLAAQKAEIAEEPFQEETMQLWPQVFFITVSILLVKLRNI